MIEKVIRYRKDNIKARLSSVTSDPAWTADGPSGLGVNGTTASKHFKCFASDGAGHDHTDATFLDSQGVWLGDYNEENTVVKSLSFNQVIEQYYDATEGGVLRNMSEGPHFNAWHTLEPDKSMWCVACRAAGRAPEAGIISQHAEFVHQSDATTFVAGPMHRTVSTTTPLLMFRSANVLKVWIYPCSLDGRKIFALLRCEKLLDSACLWSFWKADGGYTKDVFLTTVPKRGGAASHAPDRYVKGSMCSKEAFC